jgi:hypothetical protein
MAPHWRYADRGAGSWRLGGSPPTTYGYPAGMVSGTASSEVLAAVPDRLHLGDQRSRPRLAGWMLPRGQGKTSLTAVLALYELLAGAEGAQVVVATDERQAGPCHRVASRMVKLHPDLEARVQQYADAPDDQLVVWREHSAAGFEDHPVDCRHCRALANPASETSSPLTACKPACRPRCGRRRSAGRGCASSSTSSRTPASRRAAGPPAPMPRRAYRTAAKCPWSTSSRPSGRRAGAGGRWTSPPTRSGGRTPSNCWRARGCRSWSTRSHPAG